VRRDCSKREGEKERANTGRKDRRSEEKTIKETIMRTLRKGRTEEEGREEVKERDFISLL